eukprot:TRINITY_DN55381_c0_g1_i1.p1 TRINITY_DN55381_c0_g1~~TRINITY_DN55381_c0_g1_i1.p1  ORF type:complete len:612 (+),score=76.47 TRINITY_DN55381_c0_g1_i1:182-2017(+)
MDGRDAAWCLFDDSSDGGEDAPQDKVLAEERKCGNEASTTVALTTEISLITFDDIILANIVSTAGDLLKLLRLHVPATCQRFRDVMEHRQAMCWQRLPLALPSSIPCAMVTDDLVCRLVRTHGHQLLHVHLDGMRLIGPASVCKLAQQCPALRSATFVGCVGVGSMAIRFLCRQCPQLEVLRIAGCAAADVENGVDGSTDVCAADATVRAVAASCPLLRSVSLSHLRLDATIVALLESCPSLTALDLACCHRLPCSEVALNALAVAQQKLSSLKLGDCARLSNVRALDSCSNLKMLFLGGCVRLGGDSGIQNLLHGCAATIEFISLVGCHTLPPESIAAALTSARCFRVLKTLVLGGSKMNDEALAVVGEVCPSLTALDLWNCDFVTAAGLSAFFDGGAPLAQLNLRECRFVEGDVVRDIAARAHIVSLHTLDVAFIGTVLDDHVVPLLQRFQHVLKNLNCGGPNCKITQLSLDWLPQSMVALDLPVCAHVRSFHALERLELLTSLSLDGCKVPSGQLLKICKTAPLTALNVSYSNISDGTVAAIAELLPLLIDLDLSGCTSVTEVGIQAVLDHCRRLQRLGLSGCDGLSHDTIHRVIMMLPACEVVTASS